MTDEEFERLKSDPDIKYCVDRLKRVLKLSSDKRKKSDKRHNEVINSIYRKKSDDIRKVIDAYKVLQEREDIAKYLGIDSKKFDGIPPKLLSLLFLYQKRMNVRAGKMRPLYSYLRLLYFVLEFKNVRPFGQIDFVYKLFVECGFEDYGKNVNDELIIEGEIPQFELDQKERIRKMKENISKRPSL